MMHDYYNPEVKLLLVTHSDEKEKMRYDDNPNLWLVPKIGPRPLITAIRDMSSIIRLFNC
ncbi:hypothetical protein [Oceanobacillus profundus]|uniref:hypothetical protein n=1 Tax=Oceanobacillus profundus TaxID=372463 RepID=UPI003633329C